MSAIAGICHGAGPVRILSDLHLGHEMSTIPAVESLRPLMAGAATVVFNGDTYQERPSVFQTRGHAMMAELQELCREEGVRMEVIRGNHDPDAGPWEWLDLAGGAVSVTHGDVWLRLISPWSREMRFMRPVLEQIYHRAGDNPDRTLEECFGILRQCRMALPPSETRQQGHSRKQRLALFFREMWPPRRPWEILKAYAQLPGLASRFVEKYRPESRILLFGHTHRARIWHRKERLLVNTGAFATFANPLMAEIAHSRFSLFRLEFRGGAWRPGKLLVEQDLPEAGESGRIQNFRIGK